MNETAKETLDRADRLYETGDFRDARRAAFEATAGGGANPDEKKRAKQILDATGVDPLAYVVFLITLGVFVFLIFKYVL